MRIALLLLLALPLGAQEKPDGKVPSDAAHRSMKATPRGHYGTSDSIVIPKWHGAGRKDIGRVEIKLPASRGLHNPMFIWADDFTEQDAPVKILQLTPQRIVMEARRGHRISYDVYCR